jgi:hypothetical protein
MLHEKKKGQKDVAFTIHYCTKLARLLNENLKHFSKSCIYMLKPSNDCLIYAPLRYVGLCGYLLHY